MFDWNQIEQAKSLGKARIDLEQLEPFESVEQVVHLSHPKYGDKGTVRVRLLFSPEIILKERKNTSTFNTAGRAATQIGHIPMSAGRGVVHGVTGVFKRGKRTDSNASQDLDDDDNVPVTATPERSFTSKFLGKKASIASLGERNSIPAGTATTANGNLGFDPSVDGANGGGNRPEPAAVKVTVISCKDLSPADVKPYATVRVGDREFKTKHGQKTSCPEW